MLVMILKMSGVALLYVILTMVLWRTRKGKKKTVAAQLIIGIIYGLCSVLSTHYGIDFGDMLLNLRDMGPLIAGLFFGPVAGITAGTIGGVERYIVGTYFNIGEYTRIACSVSTLLAGVLAMALAIKVYKDKRPTPFYAFWMGAVTEVFHMYVVFVTHRSDMHMAFVVVRTCAVPMIVFTGIGMAVTTIVIKKMSGELRKPFPLRKHDEIPISQTFQKGLFFVTAAVVIVCFMFSYYLQTRSVLQGAYETLDRCVDLIDNRLSAHGVDTSLETIDIPNYGYFLLLNKNGTVILGKGRLTDCPEPEWSIIKSNADKECFSEELFTVKSINKVSTFPAGPYYILVGLPENKIYEDRDMQAYETGLSYILLFTVIFSVISYLVQRVVVLNIDKINKSLGKIIKGNLNEVVTVNSSSEFATLSSDINMTVTALKGYIRDAEKRIEQELEYAKRIQASALPSNFVFPNRNDFEIYASMEPAKVIGGDFYDFFFVDHNHFALVIADVSGKGIPAALFMMRSKTAIRSYAQSMLEPDEVLFNANNMLCDGNEAEMFVTVWLGIVDMNTGVVKSANAGHEFPILKRKGGDYEYVRDKHSPPLATMEGIRPRGYELKLEPGDELFVYTDGVPEAINLDEGAYGNERLLEVLNRLKDEPLKQILPAVREDVRVFANGADQFDDITLLGFRYFGESDAV